MDRRLGEKVSIITGAGAGIGEAIAHKFAKEGAKDWIISKHKPSFKIRNSEL